MEGHLKKVIDDKDKEQQHLFEEIKRLETTPPASPTEEKDGSMFALQTSLDHLKARYARIKRDKEALNKQVEEMLSTQKTLEAVETDLRSEVRDLRERLMMGAEEYKVKYLECRKLQSELKSLKKTARGNSPSSEKQSWSMEVQTNKVTKESNAVQTEATGGEVNMDDLQAQLDELGQELQDRLAKKQKYKQLYVEAKEDMELLRRKHEHELANMEYALESEKIEKDRIKEELKRRLKEQDDKSRAEIKSLQTEVKDLTARVNDLNQELADTMEQAPAGGSTTDQSVGTELQTCICQSDVKMTNAPDLDHSNPYSGSSPPSPLRVQVGPQGGRVVYPGVAVPQHNAPITTPPTASSCELHEVIVTSPPKVPPRTYRRSQPPTPPNNSASSSAPASPTNSPPVTRHLANLAAAMDPMNVSHGSDDLSPPLTPLPPPMEPQRLHSSSKAALVKAIMAKDWPGKATPVGRADSDDGVAKDSQDDNGNHGNRDQLITMEDSDVDDADERFHDAAGEAQKLCPVCNMVFPADHPQQEFEHHVDNHYNGKTCPICEKSFGFDYQQKKFEQHVNSHFKEPQALGEW